jgi:hypothetical protein
VLFGVKLENGLLKETLDDPYCDFDRMNEYGEGDAMIYMR